MHLIRSCNRAKRLCDLFFSNRFPIFPQNIICNMSFYFAAKAGSDNPFVYTLDELKISINPTQIIESSLSQEQTRLDKKINRQHLKT
jgi:hypothetical protein